MRQRKEHHPINYQGMGINEAFPSVENVSCETDDNEVEGCIVHTSDGQLLEVDVDEVQIAGGTDYATAPHMAGTYEGTNYKMNHGSHSDVSFTKDYDGVWFDLTGMDNDKRPQTCVVGTDDTGTTMVCGYEQTPTVGIDPGAQFVDSDARPFREPERYQRR